MGPTEKKWMGGAGGCSVPSLSRIQFESELSHIGAGRRQSISLSQRNIRREGGKMCMTKPYCKGQ